MKLDFSQEKIDRIAARYADWIDEVVLERVDCPVFFVKKSQLVEFLKSIQIEEGLEYNFLSDLTAYDDNPPLDKILDYGLGVVRPSNSGGPRFVVVYNLLSLQNLDRIRVKVRVAEDEEISSVTSIWKGANWLEREVYDMYGVRFSGHPNLQRILMDQRWEGHPQRKDYPIKRYQRFEGASRLESFGLENE